FEYDSRLGYVHMTAIGQHRFLAAGIEAHIVLAEHAGGQNRGTGVDRKAIVVVDRHGHRRLVAITVEIDADDPTDGHAGGTHGCAHLEAAYITEARRHRV